MVSGTFSLCFSVIVCKDKIISPQIKHQTEEQSLQQGYFQQRQQWDCAEAFHNLFPLPLAFIFIFIPEAPILSAA